MSKGPYPASPAPKRGRLPIGALLGLGIAVLAAALWLALRSSPAPPWNEQAITARFTDMTVERGHSDVHLILRYTLTNQTDHTYRMPRPTYGELLRKTPEADWKEIDTVEWDQGTPVPPRGTAVESFDLALDPLQYDMDLDELGKHAQLVAFANQRLAEMRGLAFDDYVHHYRIVLPQGWE